MNAVNVSEEVLNVVFVDGVVGFVEPEKNDVRWRHVFVSGVVVFAA